MTPGPAGGRAVTPARVTGIPGGRERGGAGRKPGRHGPRIAVRRWLRATRSASVIGTV